MSALPNLALVRDAELPGDQWPATFGGAGTPGRLYDEDRPSEFELRTMELPWRENRRSVSCIPPGIYRAEPRAPSGKFNYQHFIHRSVPDRTYILVHVGNYPRDTYGCILVGRGAADNGQPAIWRSRLALDDLRRHAPGGFSLRVVTPVSRGSVVRA